MTNDERRRLAKATLPLEVLCGQIRTNPYKEMTIDFQHELEESLETIRQLLFPELYEQRSDPLRGYYRDNPQSIE